MKEELTLTTFDFPDAQKLLALSRMERFSFRLAHRMNHGRWKRLWTWCQDKIGSAWIMLSTYNLLRVHGLEHVEAVSHQKPLLLVANHRSFFDMYVVAAVLFRRTSWPKKLFFPVRARFFYDSITGMVVNFFMGWWSMYPPFFFTTGGDSRKRAFDGFSLRALSNLCQEGPGHVVGFHPEGKRNFDPDPWSYLRPQPGVGRLVKEAKPQTIPVFIAGLGNSLVKQVWGNWNKGELIRVHFGAPIDFSDYINKRDGARTYKEISEYIMSKIAELGDNDRRIYSGRTA